MKNLFILSILTISLFSCNKEEKGLATYQFVEGVNSKPVKDTVYYHNTEVNKWYKFTAQGKIVGEGFILYGMGESPYSTEGVYITVTYEHAKKLKDRKLTIKDFDGMRTLKNPIVSPEKITFDGGEIRKK